MGAASKLQHASELQADFDSLFENIFKDICAEIILITEGAVKKIVDSSSEYLSDTARKAVNEFHKLYFAQSEVSEQKDRINKEVANIFEAIQKELADGVAEDKLGQSIEEDSSSKQARLTLAATQKQLETLISLDQNIKRKLLPVLSSMQFEDMVKQILQRQMIVWSSVKDYLEDCPSESTMQAESLLPKQHKLCERVKKLGIGTQYERKAFFNHVLKENPPMDVEKSENWFNILNK